MSPLQSPSWTYAGEHCITCGDDGVPMTVVRVDEQRDLALCADDGGTRHTVESALVEPLAAGSVVLVHAGVAIASLPGDDHPPAGATAVQRSAEAAAISANVGRRGVGLHEVRR